MYGQQQAQFQRMVSYNPCSSQNGHQWLEYTGTSHFQNRSALKHDIISRKYGGKYIETSYVFRMLAGE